MARSHHRKKHKEHLRQFKHSHDTTAVSPAAKSRAAVVFGILGALVGIAVGYFATHGDLVWVAAGLITGGVIGYAIGRQVDNAK
ncbi:MAG: hypothetical protein JNM19_02860 [Chitinophagaceae bacterium]|nr:hypothetical protein [Chitinophagaceae bacterium]